MRTRKIILLPKTEKMLVQVGENIKLARLRRKLSTEQVAQRANITKPTLWKIEKEAGSVAMAAYAQILFVVRLEKDLLKLAGDDLLGRKLQDAEFIKKNERQKPETGIAKKAAHRTTFFAKCPCRTLKPANEI